MIHRLVMIAVLILRSVHLEKSRNSVSKSSRELGSGLMRNHR